MSRRPAAVLTMHRRVYFARFGQYVKVGCSATPDKRIKSLRYDGTWKPADFDAATPGYLIGSFRGGFDEEVKTQAALIDFHVDGEWFVAEPELLDSLPTFLDGGWSHVPRTGGPIRADLAEKYAAHSP